MPSPPTVQILELLAGPGPAPLDRAVALLAVDEQPGLEPEPMLAGLDRLASGLRLREGAPLHESLARLGYHLWEEHGIVGAEEDYDDPRNSYLNEVLERRRGLPILLSVLMIEVGRRAGLALDGIGFPGHFLVSPAGAEPRFFVDPFRRGQIMREDTLRAKLARLSGGPVGQDGWERATAVASVRDVLVRMSNNLKGAWFRRGDLPGTLRSVERLVALDPQDPEHRRDRGWLFVRLGRPAEAALDYDYYLSARPQADDVDEVRGELSAIRG